jgi:hypothetical protein
MKKTISIGQTYSLDLGSLAPVVVIPIEHLENGKAKVLYVNSWPGRTEEFSYDMFGEDYVAPSKLQ